MKQLRRAISGCAALCIIACAAFTAAQGRKGPNDASVDAPDVSGEYEFLHEGEMLQLTIQPSDNQATKEVTGFISRRGELDSDRGTMLDHWIHEGRLQGNQLQFRTSTIHGIWFAFDGRIQRGAARTWADRGYYVVEGKLSEHSLGPDLTESVRSREVSLASLPQQAPEP